MGNLNIQLSQIRMNALTAKNIHSKKFKYHSNIMKIEKISTLSVPLFYLIVLQFYESSFFNNLGNALSIFLVIISIFSLGIKVEDKSIQHKKAMEENIYIAREALNLMNDPSKKNVELKWFFKFISDVDARDKELISELSDRSRKKVYREALKELIPGSTEIECPNCKSSPWNFKKGKCQLCGNKFRT